MNNEDINKLAAWGPPQIVPTKAGPRLLRKAPLAAGHPFWDVYKRNKETLRECGIQVAKYQGNWEACWWQSVNPEDDKLRQETMAAKAERALQERAALQGQIRLTSEQEVRLQQIQGKLLPYQVASVRQEAYAISTYNGDFDGSDTGVGKTYVAIAAAYVLNRPLFVVCHKPVVSSWERAAAHFGVKIGVCNYELLRMGNQPAVARIPDPKNPKDEDFLWKLPKETIIAFDECQRLCDYRTWNCALGCAAWRQRYSVLGLSATAAENPLQMKFLGLITRLFCQERDFWGWAKMNGVSKGRWGFEFMGGRDVIESIHRRIFPLHGTRIRIADLGDAFPETQITAECYNINGAGAELDRVYQEMDAEIARIEAKEQQDKGACILTALLRARQRAEILKVPAIAEMAQDAIDDGLSVAIFVNFNETLDALRAKLKTDCVIRGGQSTRERDQCIADFGTDKKHVIICNTQAGGVGVTGLHGTPTSRIRLSIICPTWSARALKQVFGRVWRALGAKSLQRIFFAAGTIEVNVQRQCSEKIKNIDTLNDGDLRNASEERAYASMRHEGVDLPTEPYRDADEVTAESIKTRQTANVVPQPPPLPAVAQQVMPPPIPKNPEEDIPF